MVNAQTVYQWNKDPDVYGYNQMGLRPLSAAKRGDHAQMRRVRSHAFSTPALCDQEQIAGVWRGKVDISMWFSLLAFDNAGDL